MAEKEELKGKIAEQEAVIQEYTDLLKRSRAEFENYQKRVERESRELRTIVKREILSKLLGLVDDTELAVRQLENAPKEVLGGVNMILAKMHKLLQEEGVTEIPCKGAPNPERHEVVLQVESGLPAGEIAQVLQKGYMMGDTVLRYSKVAVSKEE